jgi:hypothetical protein
MSEVELRARKLPLAVTGLSIWTESLKVCDNHGILLQCYVRYCAFPEAHAYLMDAIKIFVSGFVLK